MENGPRSKPNFNKLTNTELCSAFIEAVLARDNESVEECIKRDGMTILKDTFKTVPMYFAASNDKASCEYLIRFHESMPYSLLCGALIGDQIELAKYILENCNLRNDLESCVIFAGNINKLNLLEELWYPDQSNAFKIAKQNNQINEEWLLLYDVYLSQKTTESLITKHPEIYAIYIMVARKEDDMLFNYLEKNNTQENWDMALHKAIFLRHPELEKKILLHYQIRNPLYILMGAVQSGSLHTTQYYMNKFKDLCQQYSNIQLLAAEAASNGEIVIAEFILNQLTRVDTDYLLLTTAANNSGFLYAANYFSSRYHQALKLKTAVQQKKAHSLPKEVDGSTLVLDKKNVETPESKVKQLIHNEENPILEVKQQSSYISEFKDLKIQTEDLNYLLEQMLLELEKMQLIKLIHIKSNIFIHENEPAYPCLKELTLTHSWLDRTSFSMPRAKLSTLNRFTTVSLSKFYEFYNALGEQLNNIKDKPLTTAPVNIERKRPEPILQAPVIDAAPQIAEIKIKRDNYVSSYTPHFNGPSQTENTKKKKRQATAKNRPAHTRPQSVTSAPHVNKHTSHKHEQPVKLQPLPPKGELIRPPLRDSKLDFQALMRENNDAGRVQRTESSQASPYFESLASIMQHRDEILKLFANNKENLTIIYDLAILDLLLKINRDLSDEAFSTTFIHGMHHYLLQQSPSFSSAASFVNDCFNFGSKEVINPFVRDAHGFISCVRNVNGTVTQASDRFELIHKLFKLQPLCYQLCQSGNMDIKQVGRHALSGIIIAIGEQVQQLKDTEIDMNLKELAVYNVLNEYRLYRNVRHGTEYIKTVFDADFYLERDDWDQQLDNILANFNKYYCQEFVDALNITETQALVQKMRVSSLFK